MDAANQIQTNILADAAKFQNTEQLKKLTDKMTLEKRAEMAREFEAVFSSMLVKQMRESLTEGLFPGDSGDVYGGMFDLFIGKHLAATQPLGIDKMVSKYLEQAEQSQSISELK